VNKLDQAVESYQKAIAINKDYFEAYYNLGNTYMVQWDLGNAEKCYRIVNVLRPFFTEAFYNLGVVLMIQGKMPEAISNYQKVIQLNPSYQKAYSDILLSCQYISNYDKEIYNRTLKGFAKLFPKADIQKIKVDDLKPDKKLRIGYVSPDFR